MKLFTSFKKLLTNFCSSTYIHGFAYIVQPKRWKIERIFWILSIAASMTLSCVLIQKLIIESFQNPVIIYTDQNVVDVTEIFFSAVSIIPGLILKTPLKMGIDYVAIKQQLMNHEISLENFTINELKKLQIASLIARDGFMSENFNISISTDDFIERMRDDFPSFWWLNINEEFTKYGNVVHYIEGTFSREFAPNFTEVLCPTGFCYTFNFPDDINEILNTKM